MRVRRMAVVASVAVAAGLVGIGSASASVAPSAGHTLIKADGDGDHQSAFQEAELQSPYDDAREMVDVYGAHKRPY